MKLNRNTAQGKTQLKRTRGGKTKCCDVVTFICVWNRESCESYESSCLVAFRNVRLNREKSNHLLSKRKKKKTSTFAFKTKHQIGNCNTKYGKRKTHYKSKFEKLRTLI